MFVVYKYVKKRQFLLFLDEHEHGYTNFNSKIFLFLFFFSGGKTYDKDHVVIMPESDERPNQQWEIELL